MTLILTCATRNYIVQVADRQVTWPDGRVEHDDRTKGVFYCGGTCVAFCGLAEMEGEETAMWLARQMYDVPHLEPALQRVAARAEMHLAARAASDKRMAFVAATFGLHHGVQHVRAAVVVVSNFLSPDDVWLYNALPTFRQRLSFLPHGRSHMLLAVGQPLHGDEVTWLNREIRRCLRRDAEPDPIARLLAELIWAISDGSDFRSERVGNGLLIQVISREALEAGEPLMVTPITKGIHSFRYFSPDRSSDPFIGPVAACSGAIAQLYGGSRVPGESIFTHRD